MPRCRGADESRDHAQGGGDAAAADKEYCNAINKISSVFGKQKRSNSTAAEHRMYMRMIDGWLVRKCFGSYVEADVEFLYVYQKNSLGSCGANKCEVK